ncbi:MAG: CDP-glucose 4,6-dehydratase [Syntrophorhabdales bacterium]|jgi:CDP-glucose 4,6-dehydratase
MEDLVMEPASLFQGIYDGKRVLVTGHTGFKGSWLCAWLIRLGAEVRGYSLPPPTEPNHFDKLCLGMGSVIGDVRDQEKLRLTFEEFRPDIVFHLAAQPIVRRSYEDPVETFTTNSLGTMNVLEACRAVKTVRAIVLVTSDKCYENKEWSWGYRENDRLGGYDPYSASKACAELIAGSWRNSFFSPEEYGKSHRVLLATVRAGNVLGGGDWAADRIIPDIARAASAGAQARIRNPRAIRPWQHVLEPLSGYLLLGQRLFEGRPEFSGAWNFGPSEESRITVKELVELAAESWSSVICSVNGAGNEPGETGSLMLDSAKARSELGWTPVWNIETAVSRTISWYRAFYERRQLRTGDDIDRFVQDAGAKRTRWVMQ